MALEVTIAPSLSDSGNGTPTTELEITVDLSSIYNMLDKYDLLLKVKLTVETVNIESNKTELNVYEYAQIYRNIANKFITTKMFVLGHITNTWSITGIAEGVYVNKNVNGVG